MVLNPYWYPYLTISRFNGKAVDVNERVSHFTKHFIEYVITYYAAEIKLIPINKSVPWCRLRLGYYFLHKHTNSHVWKIKAMNTWMNYIILHYVLS